MKHTKVLLYGNIGYIDKSFLKHVFRNVNVLMLGDAQINQTLLSGVTILPFSGESKEIYEVFDSYEFDQIVYFSDYLSYKKDVYGEVERLKTILELCRKQEKVKLLYIDGPFVDSGIYENTVIQRGIYNLIEEYSSGYHVDVKLLYIPYLYSMNYKKDYIHSMTENLIQLEQFKIFERRDHVVPFISLDDLADLVYKILDSWKADRKVLSVEDSFKVPIEKLVELMASPNEKIQVQYGEESFSIMLPKSEVDIRKEYGWIQRYSILAEYRDLYEDFTKANAFTKKVLDRSKGKKGHPLLMFRKLIEILVLFVLVEMLEFFSNIGGHFAEVDFRLILVAIVSIIYGAGSGVMVSALVSFGFVVEYLINGNNWQTLFYNSENWMPIIIYLFVGSVCGYFQMRKHDDFELVQYEKDKLESKYNFTRQLYTDIILDKKMMKNEITGMREGMGKISRIIERLSKSGFPEMGETVTSILNEWFETDSAQMHLLKKYSDDRFLFENTETDFHELPFLKEALFEDGIFANTGAMQGYPIYASLVHISGNLYAMLRIWRVDPEHITLYDRNALKMLTGIIEAMMTKKYFGFLEENQNSDDNNVSLDDVD